MTDLAQIRRLCAEVINEVTTVEQSCAENLESVRQRNYEARQRIVAQDDQIENFLLASRSRSESMFNRASRLLIDLNLPRGQPSQFTVQDDLSIQQAVDLVQDLLNISEELLQEIELIAAKLNAERQKWWKFW